MRKRVQRLERLRPEDGASECSDAEKAQNELELILEWLVLYSASDSKRCCSCL